MNHAQRPPRPEGVPLRRRASGAGAGRQAVRRAPGGGAGLLGPLIPLAVFSLIGVALWFLITRVLAPDLDVAPRGAPSTSQVRLDEPAAAPRVGSPAPSLSLNDAEGRPISLETLRGRTVLLNFWASWCLPCEREMTDLQTLYAAEAERGLVVIGVNEGEEPNRATEFLRAKGITFPTVFDETGDVARRYQVFGLPNSFLIDPSGVVQSRVVGPYSLDQMREQLTQVRTSGTVAIPRAVLLGAALSATNGTPAGEVNGETITFGDVYRRIDLETALNVIRGGLAPDLTMEVNRAERERLYRDFTQRLIDERIVTARAAQIGLAVSTAEVDADIDRIAAEMDLNATGLAAALDSAGSDIAVLRDTQANARLFGRFAEHILTGKEDAGLQDYESWFAAARERAGARILPPPGT